MSGDSYTPTSSARSHTSSTGRLPSAAHFCQRSVPFFLAALLAGLAAYLAHFDQTNYFSPVDSNNDVSVQADRMEGKRTVGYFVRLIPVPTRLIRLAKGAVLQVNWSVDRPVTCGSTR